MCSELFWNEMARKPEDRFPLTRSSANDLLFSVLLNRQVSWEAAMGAVAELKYRTGYDDSLRLLLALSVEQLEFAMFSVKPSLHRYRYMASYLKLAAEHLQENYGGDARGIFWNTPLASEARENLLEIKGYGTKLANLFLRLAVLQNNANLWDGYGGIQLSCDVHVRRVGSVLGLWQEDDPVKTIEAKASELAPTEPLIFDALFLVGIEHHQTVASPNAIGMRMGCRVRCGRRVPRRERFPRSGRWLFLGL